MQFPECSLPFLGGRHSLVMFTLMSYMLISHGPSAPLWMGLWGDIPGLAGSAQGASSSASRPTATPWAHFRLPAVCHPQQSTLSRKVLSQDRPGQVC